MDEEKWDRILQLTLLVNIVYIERPKTFDLDVTSELRDFVHLSFMLSPIETGLPSGDQPFDIC